MPDELTPTPAPQAEPTPPEQPPQEPQATEPAAQPVDNPPDPASLDPEVKRLQEVRDKARKDAEYWRKEKTQARADYFKSRQPFVPQAAPPTASEPQPPKQEDFDDYNKYQSAHSKFLSDLVDYRTNQKIQVWEQTQAQKVAESNYQQRLSTLQEKINVGFEKYPDFEDVAMADTVPINQVVMDVLAETDHPEDIAYYLGKNRSEAIQISRMNPLAAARAISRIEMQIKQTPPDNGVNRMRNVTNAPPPIRPVGSSNTVQKDLEKMSQREFEAEMVRRTGKRF